MNRSTNLILCLLFYLLPLSESGGVSVAMADGSDPKNSTVKTNIEQVDLFVDRKMERGDSCNFALRLHNTTSFRIRNLVPQFSAIIKNNVVFATISAEFFEINPSREQGRTIRFRGISCSEITGLKVHGANNCRMGSLNRNTATSLECLRRIKVNESSVVNIFKEE